MLLIQSTDCQSDRIVILNYIFEHLNELCTSKCLLAISRACIAFGWYL